MRERITDTVTFSPSCIEQAEQLQQSARDA